MFGRSGPTWGARTSWHRSIGSWGSRCSADTPACSSCSPTEPPATQAKLLRWSAVTHATSGKNCCYFSILNVIMTKINNERHRLGYCHIVEKEPLLSKLFRLKQCNSYLPTNYMMLRVSMMVTPVVVTAPAGATECKSIGKQMHLLIWTIIQRAMEQVKRQMKSCWDCQGLNWITGAAAIIRSTWNPEIGIKCYVKRKR